MISILTALAFWLGWVITTVIFDVYEQVEANKFRQAVGLEKKAVRIRRYL